MLASASAASSEVAHGDSPALYERLAPYYDLMSRGLLVPFGGDTYFRKTVVNAWSIRPGDRVLELGCGTGLMTRILLDRGAVVTSVDRSRPMLARANRRAPEATFIEHDVTTFAPTDRYERVVLSYVLHELTEQQRAAVLAIARAALAPFGTVCVVDFDAGASRVVRPFIDAYLRAAEPPSAREWADRGFIREVAAAGFATMHTKPVAWGTARLAVLVPR
ncbi:MAG TPA: methyltransferase domain-containing protein [Kofleriaceae bacterium]|jgi:ubiquinone/menaquinone biosynthesis C-methylase UbiE